MWLLLSHLQVQPVVRLSVNPRHTHTDTHAQTDKGYDWLCRLPQTRSCLRQHLPVIYIGCTQNVTIDTKFPSSSSAGKDWSSYTALSRFVSTCTFTDPLTTITAPLSIQYDCPLNHSMGLTRWSSFILLIKYTHSSHRHPTLTFPPTYQHGRSTCMIPQPGPRAFYSLSSPAWSLLGNDMYTPLHTRFGEEVKTLSLHWSQHQEHRLWPTVLLQPPALSSSWVYTPGLTPVADPKSTHTGPTSCWHLVLAALIHTKQRWNYTET